MNRGIWDAALLHLHACGTLRLMKAGEEKGMQPEAAVQERPKQKECYKSCRAPQYPLLTPPLFIFLYSSRSQSFRGRENHPVMHVQRKECTVVVDFDSDNVQAIFYTCRPPLHRSPRRRDVLILLLVRAEVTSHSDCKTPEQREGNYRW